MASGCKAFSLKSVDGGGGGRLQLDAKLLGLKANFLYLKKNYSCKKNTASCSCKRGKERLRTQGWPWPAAASPEKSSS